MEYGGCDVSRTFCELLQRVGFSPRSVNLSHNTDAMLFQELKENLCHLDHVSYISIFIVLIWYHSSLNLRIKRLQGNHILSDEVARCKPLYMYLCCLLSQLFFSCFRCYPSVIKSTSY